MKAPSLLFGSVVLLAACGDAKPPAGVSSTADASLPGLDAISVDTPAPSDRGDAAPSPADGDATATPVDGDAPADVAADATADVPADAPADVPAAPSGLCMWSHGDLSAFALRFALCALRAPQTALNTYFNPENWEGGPLAARACPALRCVSDTSAPGTCSAWMGGCLKYDVVRVPGACPAPAANCEGTPPNVHRSCVDGIETRDRCGALGLRCVSSASAAACVPTVGAACTPGAPARCNGDVLEQCVLGVFAPTRNCALTGGVCDAAAGTCRGAGAPCAAGAATECDGTQLSVCRGGRRHAIDCGRLVTGAACQTVNGHSFCGVDRECDPTVAAPGGVCDANTMVLCAAGRTLRYVCESRNGFSRCESGVGCVP